MHRMNWPIQWGPHRAPGTPKHVHRHQDSYPAPTQHPDLWATVGKGEGSGEAQGSNVQRSAVAQASCVGGGGSQQLTELGPRPQTTRFQDMALDRVPRRVGVVGYGRLGESLTIWGLFPRPLPEAPKGPMSSTNTPLSVSPSAPWLAESA